ncbi:hypothetical protein [Crateriforma spongiae]|uniref:hypothetical protein n=1 Tax=Crateriforma spongiae TaxID=2724528 RepID=UPI0039B0DB0C
MCDSRRSKIAAILVRAMQRRGRAVFANADDAVQRDRERTEDAEKEILAGDSDKEVRQ